MYRLQDAVLLEAARHARDTGNIGDLVQLGGELERRGLFPVAWEMLAAGAELRKPLPAFPIWDGRPQPGKTLLVYRRIRHLGAELRMSRFIGPASCAVGRVIVATEPRLIDLMQRTFPEAVFVPSNDREAYKQADFEASHERLAVTFGASSRSISEAFRPLVPPPGARAEDGGAISIGISWYSSSVRKPLPDVGDWVEALGQKPYRFVSLQYDEPTAGFDRLDAGLPQGLVTSRPIDQMVDVDGFAGQVSATDGVLTISNTTAHMAGSIGVPCVVLLDDLHHLTWPYEGQQSPFYPHLVTIRQAGRPWKNVIALGLERLLDLMKTTDRKRQ